MSVDVVAPEVNVRLPQLAGRHRVFAEHFLLNGNKSAVAREAGCVRNSAGVTAQKWLKRPDVLAYLEARRQQIEAQHGEDLSARVTEELKAMAFVNAGKFLKVDPDSGELRFDFTAASPQELEQFGRAVTQVKSKTRTLRNNKGESIGDEHESAITLADKYRGLELLGRTLGMFKADEHKVVVDVADRLLAARRRLESLPRD